MTSYIVTVRYTLSEQVEVEADDEGQALLLGKKKIGRKDSEYENIEYEVEQGF